MRKSAYIRKVNIKNETSYEDSYDVSSMIRGKMMKLKTTYFVSVFILLKKSSIVNSFYVIF